MAARVVMPSFGMYTVEGTVAAWLVAPGGTVEAGQPIVEITTDKASYEIESPAAGVFRPVVGVDATLQVETLIALVLAPGESWDEALAAGRAADPADAGPSGGSISGAPAPTPPPPAPADPADPRQAEAEGAPRGRISPLARRLAIELNVDLAEVTGSGPGGRIVEADVRAAAARRE